MTLTRTDEQTVGRYRIDTWATGSPTGSIVLSEGTRKELEVTVPLGVFDRDTYPSMGEGVEGEVIRTAIGSVRGAKAFLVDTSAGNWKVLGHSVTAMTGFVNQNGQGFVPDTIDLANAEFTYAAWNGEDELFCSVVADSENAIDACKTLLTDSVRGANLDTSRLDTTSSGKGYGATGARLKQVYGIDPADGAEANEFAIGLYMDEAKPVKDWLKQVAAAAFLIVYVDQAGLYTVKSWEPEPGEGLDVIGESNIIGGVRVKSRSEKPYTRCVVRYDLVHGLDGQRVVTYEDDQLRQLRGLSQHATLPLELPLSDRFGAIYHAERQVWMRGNYRRTLEFTCTQEFSTKEPGDYVRLEYSRANIDEVVEVLSTTVHPGTWQVTMVVSDIRSFRDQVGFYTADNPTFPASLGGGAITGWDDTWSDAQKQWFTENLAAYLDDDCYADQTDDAQKSFAINRYV